MFKALEKKIIQVSGQQYQPAILSFEGLLVAASYLYGTGTGFRNRLYRSGCLEQKSLPCPVISLGNITAGGTGKTPMAIYMADLLTRLGRKPVVISRGYKGGLKETAAVVGNGCDLFLGADQAGDEPHMMARMKRFPVVVGKNRYQAGLLALEHLSMDIMVLDDGFQHIRLKRDIDLLLLDHDQPFGNGRMLPAGRLREPAARALARAHALILTRCQNISSRKPHPVSRLAPHLPVFYTIHQPFLYTWISGADRNPHARLDSLKGLRVLLFSGISDNPSFYRTIQNLGARICDHLEFADHYRYKGSDLCRIQDRAVSLGADLLVTTQKDWAKLDPWNKWAKDLAVVGVHLVFTEEKSFQSFITDQLHI
ncbi:MAG TPA: tetraacyldisaccharide 4'-kinase [Desulfotignum sp.]|nr:tetraacyldisaccharide 4'-kinase [Desulfotignum sp.]